MSQIRPGRRVRVEGDLFHGRVPGNAVYVGRGAPGLPRSPFHNPHSIGPKGCRACSGRVHDRAEALALYREGIRRDPELLACMRAELTGRDLACWCHENDPCHVDVILQLLAEPLTTEA